MPQLEDIQQKQTELIRKMTAASLFIAPEGAALPTTLTTGGVREVQSIAITGTPTGGTFTLTLSDQTTAPIAYDATAAAVVTALTALSNIGAGGVTATGGPLPGTAVAVTFHVGGNVATMTATSSLTGGTTPAVTVTATTEGTEITLAALPAGAGYTEIGLVTKDDGYSFAAEEETSEVTSHGYADPTRRDIISTTSTVGFTAQETKRRVLELFHNVDLTGVVADTVSGEVAFNKALQPATRYYRAFLIARDGIGANAIYMAVLYPRAMVSERGDQTGSEGSEFSYPLTLTATPDTAAGYASRWLFGGPGWRKQLAGVGF